jgi:glycosyltransferase involved in cell wall biosynthesis
MISIVINNYNYARFLGEAIESALGQTFSEVEVIVVDDGSTDESCKVITQYKDRVVVVLKDNGGQASAFNAGVEAARGDWVMLLDADDRLDACAAASIQKAVSIVPDGAVWGEFFLRFIDENGEKISAKTTQPPRMDVNRVKRKLLKCGAAWFAPTSGMFFNRKKLASAFPMPEEGFRISADMYLHIAFSFLGGDPLVLNQTMGNYRLHGNNRYYCEKRLPDNLTEKWARDVGQEELKQNVIRSFACREGLKPPDFFPMQNPNLMIKKMYLCMSDPSKTKEVEWFKIWMSLVKSSVRPQHPRAALKKWYCVILGLRMKLASRQGDLNGLIRGAYGE